MRIERKNIRGSPYVGIFASVTDKIGLFPRHLSKKELKAFEDVFGVEALSLNLAGCSLLGVLCRGNKRGFLMPKIAEKEELEALASQGIKTKPLALTAIGNLIALNDSKGIASEAVPPKTLKEIEAFLKIKVERKNLAGIEITGSSLVVTNKAFIVNPNVSETEFKFIEKTFGFKGLATTANYGDPFVANNVVANSFGVIAGNLTSGPEMARIDEALVR